MLLLPGSVAVPVSGGGVRVMVSVPARCDRCGRQRLFKASLWFSRSSWFTYITCIVHILVQLPTVPSDPLLVFADVSQSPAVPAPLGCRAVHTCNQRARATRQRPNIAA